MDITFTTAGALIGLALSIFLIIKKIQPAYSLIIGALIGGLIGSGDLVGTVEVMITGAQGMMSSVIRILTSGILAGALIKTGAAEKIAEVIVAKLGEKRTIVSIAIATMVICMVGVFIDIAVITVAPIALAIGNKVHYNKGAILLAMIGGGKAGNIISPNPNTIAVSEGFHVNLTSLMAVNIVPAIGALIMTVILATILSKRSGGLEIHYPAGEENKSLPSLWAAIAGPVVVILLLALRPLFNIVIDPLIALPLGGLVSTIACGEIKKFPHYMEFGLTKVIGVSVLLIGTGTIAGIIKASALQGDVVSLLEMMHLPSFILAPIAGIVMGAATASTTAGATIASQTFSGVLLKEGIPAIFAGAMVHTGATVLDSLPHGSFFHATGGSVDMNIKNRMRLIPYEALIGLTSTILSIIWYLIFR
ncbi:GntP family permease [Enterococcus asini]|uniref:GntP family permease n=1 Tax=Enterococcus asini TaxID=57732 RepID=A0AAW8U450_9ENTE|nr:GntP family permease [Enterococcus asini]MDT2811037.1 GntP family permease [Enterococcus asini]RGW12908.1 GntP family permease [Enterococcus asini]